MKNNSTPITSLPPEQKAMWDNCFHPSGTFVEFPIEDVETSIPERFEKIVATYPDRVAVKTPNRHLTYAQLNSMANRVAHAILAQHGNESEPVGLLLEKDVALIAAMLGVLKAGKFFALLDPSFPQARIGAILEDSQTGLVLTDQRNLALAREAAGEKRRVIDVGSMGFPLAMENLRLQISPKALAYIIYTSGSTGQPKGVVQNHRNLLHRVMLYTNAYHICSGDRLSLLPTGTSNTVTHGFTALLTGASLFPYDAREQGSPALASWLICEKISFCWISSPLFRNLVASLTGSERFPDLRLIQLTSETVYRTDVDLYKKHFSRDCLLACGLSSSETGLLRLFLFDQKTEISGNEAPVGYAIQDKEIALLDNAGKTVAFNQIGTIVVRSRYLSPGYWNRPDLTEAKFKPDPQGGEVRLYFTGDIGVMLPDGCLIHKGRKDFRVKIRGYGVELAEIERALLEHDAVREAVVTTQQNPSGDARLIAYFTPVNSLGPGVSALLRYLKKKLPDYMIPTTLVRLDTLPLTSNGKVNRSALPIPGKSRPELDTLFTVPRTSVEETLAKIWAEVLGLDQIGIGDNFFDLGGNSLLAMRVISRILDRFQVELPLIDFFATPTIADLAGYIETANLAQRRTEALSIQPTSRDGRLLLSSAQQRLWFLDQLEPGSFAYNLCSATQLTGRLDVPALHRSFNEIIMRHEALRTVFKAVDGEPLQIILPSLTLELPIVDLRGIASDTERDHELRRLCTAEAQRSFDLARGPLLRITLLRLSEEEYILLRTIHHVVFDGWSSGILAQELAAFYKAFSDGTPLSLPALPIQYADFAQWQQQWMRGAVYKREIAYWKKKLENLPTLHLPTDRPRPPVQKAHGAREYFAFSESLSARLKSLGNRHQVTLFMTLLAAYQTLLYRYTGQNDIVVGSPVAGRNRRETEGLIGFFLNMLVLQTDLSGNPTFRELLSRVREVCLESYAHQEVPFEKLVEELQPDRDLNRNPLFQVAFVFQDTTLFPLELPGLTAKELEFDPGITRFDLRLFVAEEEGRLRGCIDYNADLFHQSTITRLLRHLQTLLEGIVSNPDERIERLAILTAPERRKLLIDWTDNEQDYPRDRCIHELFEAEVERAPNAAAVVFEDQQLTYTELNRAANKLARHLRKLGVAAEATVGICIERSLEMVVGVLGILKAGGAYVYLDPTFPKERLAFIMGDAGVRVLLTRKHLLENLPEYSGRAIFLDRDSGMFLEEEDSNVQATSDPESLAYVVYTSGSTGKPKGVLSHHRGVANYLGYIRKTYHLHNTDTVLQLPSLSFDASVRDLIGPLTAGAKVVLVKDTAAKDPTVLLSKISQHRVTCLLSVVPTMLNGLINAASGDGSPYDSVRLILVSGEALQLSAHAKAKEVFGRDVFLVNQYGPTECTMTSTYWPVQTLGYHREALIGKPIPNARIYILDGDLNPVPIGVPGQIYIGGDGLAWGYLNRPELTAETFVPNRFGDKRGARLYSTGDLGRYLSDGNIEFLGRIDNQVKIRGFRVELGEIEAVIGRCPSVQQAVVLAREKGIGDRWLVAYIVPNSETAPPASEVSGFLRNKLPDYMVPSAFVFLDSLPLTPNGKVNRKALPVPSQNCPEFEESFVAPRTPVEELLANTWAEVLKLDRAGVHDNFFDLGGHSLLATQVISRICQAFKVELPLRALFERPTVAELAKRIEEAHGEDPRLSTRPMVPVCRDRDLPLSFSQQRLWFLDQYEPNSSVYNIPRALRLRGPLNIGALEQSLNEIIRRHESLRTTFSMVDGEAVQMIAPSVGLSLAVVDLRDHPEGEREEEARRLANEEALGPFDLARGPLFRSKLVQLGEDDHVLLLTMHHIVSDGWSMGVLDRELSVLYGAFSRSQPSPLRELPIQYADYAVWQREWLQGEVLERQLSYWKQLGEIPGVLDLPTDHPRPAIQSYRGARQSLVLSKDLTEQLKALTRRQGVTLFMTLLAAFQTLLYRYAGQEDIVVGSPIANRNRTEIEGLIGFFVNTLVLRTNFDGDPTFKELLARVRRTTLGAYEHQDLPFEKLMEELKPERNLSYSPLFQVMLVLQNAPTTDRGLEGLNVSPLRIGAETAKFDLTLSMHETAEGLSGSLQYNTDLFDDATITRMLEHFQILLKGIVVDPHQRISDLPILTEAEKRQLLVEWNDTKRDYPKDKCIHELFEEQVEKTPDAVAVVFEDQRVTYHELNTRANQLAHYLGKLGVGPEVLVGICMERSIDMIVGLLGILKAGGAYVPLDPSYPKERLAFMLEDTQAAVLLTQERLIEKLPPHGAQLVCLDKERKKIAAESDENPTSGTTAENLAYVIYTSGSTGEPKGVAITHASSMAFLSWVSTVFSATEMSGVLASTSICFDLSVFEIFSPLSYGGRIILVQNALSLASLSAGSEVTLINTVPSALNELLRVRAVPPSVCTINLAGEPLKSTLVEEIYDRTSTSKVYDLYGPSEDTTYSTFALRTADGPQTIGKPIANTRIYILDAHLQPVPIGIAGELYIGGDGLVRGYLNRPELTAEKFIPSPFSDDPNSRLYRTGDLARYLSDGSIEFLGRIDNQVKIRGFRIELGEIEAILSQHPFVRETVVLAREDSPGDKRLVAYVVSNQDQVCTGSALRNFLKEKLPEYMIPSGFVFLDALPLTPNGKVDRKALPAPDQSRPELEQSFVVPRTPIEEIIAEVWAEVLKLEKVGIHDNFFDLGGHSLLATQIISRVRDAFQMDIPLRTLFEKPTVEELAIAIMHHSREQISEKELSGILNDLESLSKDELKQGLV